MHKLIGTDENTEEFDARLTLRNYELGKAEGLVVLLHCLRHGCTSVGAGAGRRPHGTLAQFEFEAAIELAQASDQMSEASRHVRWGAAENNVVQIGQVKEGLHSCCPAPDRLQCESKKRKAPTDRPGAHLSQTKQNAPTLFRRGE